VFAHPQRLQLGDRMRIGEGERSVLHCTAVIPVCVKGSQRGAGVNRAAVAHKHAYQFVPNLHS
jgi:hypothetical protein